ncbi:hypothetical protein [Actinomadura soli]|uniref:hypothetical protein n=1 Tax=Actinomadura soli TaxID=2508997 RepID=UPI001E531061|nr:hypothetical protein [Actinomadura soli]
METVIAATDEIILLAEDDLLIRLARGARPLTVDEAITTAAPQRRRPERTLLLGWNHRASKIIYLLDDYVEPGSSLDIAAPGDDPCDALPPLTNLTIGHTTCDSTDRTQLEALNVGSYKHIIVLSAEDRAPEHADARALVTCCTCARWRRSSVTRTRSSVRSTTTPTGRSRRSPRPMTSWSATS